MKSICKERLLSTEPWLMLLWAYNHCNYHQIRGGSVCSRQFWHILSCENHPWAKGWLATQLCSPYCLFELLLLLNIFRMKKSPGPNPLILQKVSNRRMSTWSTERTVTTSWRHQETWSYFWSPWIDWSGITLLSHLNSRQASELHPLLVISA